MNYEELKQRLREYRVQKAQLETDKIEKRKTERLLKTEHSDRLEVLAGAGAQKISGTPGRKGGKPKSTVEEAVVKLIDEPTEAEKRMRARIEELDAQITELTDKTELVETWLGALNEREKTVIWHRDVMGMSWAYVSREYEQKFGYPMSDKALQITEARGLKIICEAAGNVV